MLAYFGGVLSPGYALVGGADTASPGWYFSTGLPPGYGPAAVYEHALATVVLVPYKLVGYATLAGAVSLADGRAIVGVLAAVAYGASIELLQLGVSYRSGSALDALANATGAVVGALAVVAVVDAYRRYDARGSSRSTVEK